MNSVRLIANGWASNPEAPVRITQGTQCLFQPCSCSPED